MAKNSTYETRRLLGLNIGHWPSYRKKSTGGHSGENTSVNQPFEIFRLFISIVNTKYFI